MDQSSPAARLTIFIFVTGLAMLMVRTIDVKGEWCRGGWRRGGSRRPPAWSKKSRAKNVLREKVAAAGAAHHATRRVFGFTVSSPTAAYDEGLAFSSIS